MLWGLVGLIALGVLAVPAWRLFQGWRLASIDDGLMKLLIGLYEQPEDKHIEWLGQAVAAERQGKARPGHLATLEIVLAMELGRADRKQDALVLYQRHLPQHGVWEKYLGREDVLVMWGITAWQRGQYASARTAIDAALEEAPKDSTVLRMRGLVERKLTADPTSTGQWFERSLEASEPEERAFNRFKVSCYLASLRDELGELEAAATQLSDALSSLRSSGLALSVGQRVEVAGFVLRLVRVLCRLGRVTEARQALDAMDMPDEGRRGIEMGVEATRFELQSAEGDTSGSATRMRALIDEAERRKDADSVGAYTLALAHIEARAGRKEACRAALVAARELFKKVESRADTLSVECAARRLGVEAL